MKHLILAAGLLLALNACGTLKGPKKTEPARKALSQSDRERVQAHYVDGVYAYAEGNTEKAMASWKQALAIDPRHAPTLKAMAEARQKQDAVKKLKDN